MAGMGPPPKDNSSRRRRNATVATTKLPGEGRKKAAPPWPLPLLPDQRAAGAQHKLELTIWRQLWRTPQAVMWERLLWARDVAAYARNKSLAELGDLDREKEARLLGDRLGLTPMALLRLRWEIAADEVGAKRDQRAAASPAAALPAHLWAVDPNAATGTSG